MIKCGTHALRALLKKSNLHLLDLFLEHLHSSQRSLRPYHASASRKIRKVFELQLQKCVLRCSLNPTPTHVVSDAVAARKEPYSTRKISF